MGRLALFSCLSFVALGGCHPTEEVSANVSEEHRLAVEETERALQQHRNADVVLRWYDQTWNEFKDSVDFESIEGQVAVVKVSKFRNDPDDEMMDEIDRLLKEKGFEKVIWQKDLAFETLILRE